MKKESHGYQAINEEPNALSNFMHPPLRWAATFSTVFLDGNPEWRVGARVFPDR
jgi:hypothetical protein